VAFAPLRRFEKGTRVGRQMGTYSGLTERTTKVASLESLEVPSLLRFLAGLVVRSFALKTDSMMKG